MENIGFGLQISVVGMGLVFGLLALLWGVLALVGRLDQARAERRAARQAAPDIERTPDELGLAQPVLRVRGGEGLPPEALAAITIAVAAHVSNRRRQAAPALRSHMPGSLLFASRWVASGRARQNRSWQRGRR